MSTHPIWIVFLAIAFSIQLTGQETQVFSLIEDQTDPYFGTLEFEPTPELAGFQHLSIEQWQKILKLYPAQDSAVDYSNLPPMLGEVVIEDGRVYFAPRFPFMRGQSYLLQLNIKMGFELIKKHWQIGQKLHYEQLINIPGLVPKVATFVENIYPSTANWPANQLKFYIYFSNPMRFGEAFKYIKLYDEKGHQIEHAFLLVEQELWDQERKRLTVWFDPGRIKRGLIPNLELGPPLQKGQRFTLKVCKEWLDLNGQMLAQSFVKEIRVGPADRTIPDPEDWILIPPGPATRDTLRLLFKEPMDFALMQSAIVVMDEGANRVEGEIYAAVNEMQWCFVPNLPWKKASYKIRVSHDLEDLAGNNLLRLFDAEPEPVNKKQDLLPYTELTFNIGDVQSKK